MQSWRMGKGLVVGLVLAMGACSSVEGVSAPENVRYEEREATPPDSSGFAPRDEGPGDSTGGRWGGFMGGGTG